MTNKMLVIVAALSITLLAAAPVHSRGRTNAASAVQPVKATAFDAISIPHLLSYQGKLDSMGVPVNGTCLVHFGLYADSLSGSPFWSETQTVSVNAGLFSVLLGSSSPIDSFPQAGACYLGMTVGSDTEMRPRLRIASAAYAFLARKADTANYALAATLSRPITPPVVSSEIADTSVIMSKLAPAGATTGQVLKWTGSAWAPRSDSVGGGGGGESAWVRVGGDSVLYTIRQLGIARGGSGNVLSGNARMTHVNFGVACSTSSAGSDAAFCTVAGGDSNRASSQCATVAGGVDNSAHGDYSTVAGGGHNSAGGGCATVSGGFVNMAAGDNSFVGGGSDNTTGIWAQNAAVAGGCLNTADSIYTFVGGGLGNRAGGRYATVAGGYEDTAGGAQSFVGGGQKNRATYDYASVEGGLTNVASDRAATVSGGEQNTASAADATVGGGVVNSATSAQSVVSGGQGNTANGIASAVGGGMFNVATGNFSSVGGGESNTAIGNFSFIAAGSNDSATGLRSSVGGGWHNSASGSNSVVGGGLCNTSSQWYATVAGGDSNSADNNEATVGGGLRNTAALLATVAGGQSNTSSGTYGAIGGGFGNSASGHASTVCGGDEDTSAADNSFTTNQFSKVPSSFSNSSAFSGMTATAANQVRCSNLLATGTKSFAIDDPLDPNGKILNHYCIESPEVVNLYRGAVVLGSDGRAEVQLPDYFSAENTNPMIQVSGVGTNDAYVAQEVVGNAFIIGGKPGVKVFWTVTADRNDQSARIGQLLTPVEQPKTGVLAGCSLDDDFLVGCMQQLEAMGKAGEFSFRTAAGRQRYEDMLKQLREAEQQKPQK